MNPSISEEEQTPRPMTPGASSNTGGQLLNNFMALRLLVFYRGVDVETTKTWMLSAEKHLWAMDYTKW